MFVLVNKKVLSCFVRRAGAPPKPRRARERKKIRRIRNGCGSPVYRSGYGALMPVAAEAGGPPPFIIRHLVAFVIRFIVFAFPLGRKYDTKIARIFRSGNISRVIFVKKCGVFALCAGPPAAGRGGISACPVRPFMGTFRRYFQSTSSRWSITRLSPHEPV